MFWHTKKDEQLTPKLDRHEFDKEVLRHLGLPEDYVPADENEAYRLIIAALED